MEFPSIWSGMELSQGNDFGVIPHDRQTASGDAFMAAQVFLRLLRLASRHGCSTLGKLMEPFEPSAS